MNLIPNTMPLQYEVKQMTDSIPLFLDKNGTIYGQKNGDQNQLRKSTDWGNSWTDLVRLSGTIDIVRVLDDDSMILETRSGVLYRSTDGGATATEVYAPASGYVPQWSGIDTYGPFVLFAPYSNNTDCKIFLSTDYGKSGSWSEIFNGSTGGMGHCHVARFDPYENIIWTAWGDHRPRETIVFSDDFGRTWQTLPDNKYMRVTNIMPLPDCVLFGSDEMFWMGTYRHVRPECGTSQHKVLPEFHWAAKKGSEDNAPNIWSTKPAIVYGKDGIAFWSYRQSGCPILPAQVYASKGEKVVSIWCDTVIPNGTNTGSGIEAIYGPDNNGNLLVQMHRYTSGGTEQWMLKLTLDNDDAVLAE